MKKKKNIFIATFFWTTKITPASIKIMAMSKRKYVGIIIRLPSEYVKLKNKKLANSKTSEEITNANGKYTLFDETVFSLNIVSLYYFFF